MCRRAIVRFCRASAVGLFRLRSARAIIWLCRLIGLICRFIVRFRRASGVGLFRLGLARAIIWLCWLIRLICRFIVRFCRSRAVGLFGLSRRRGGLVTRLRRLIGLACAIRWLV